MKQPLAGAIKSLWKNPWKLFVILTHYGFFTHIADEPYLRLVYRGVTGRRLRLDPPETYNEKMQWLKLHDKNPAYPKLVDKLAVREFVRECVGGELLNPLLGVWSDPRDIDFSALPERFVLKCSHDSGSAILCYDKAALDEAKTRRTLKRLLAKDYAAPGREWPYKDVPRRILAESYIGSADGTPPVDYKFFCFDGKARIVLVCVSHHGAHAENYTFNMEFEPVSIYRAGSNRPADFTPERPPHFAEMIEIVEKLAKGFKHMRVDLYDTPDGIRFGELTLHSSSGLSQTLLETGDRLLGDYLNLE